MMKTSITDAFIWESETVSVSLASLRYNGVLCITQSLLTEFLSRLIHLVFSVESEK